MALIIDTSVLISLERRQVDPVSTALLSLDDAPAISAITAAELLFGVERAGSEGRRARRTVFVESVLELVEIVPLDLEVSRHLAALWSELTTAGTPIGHYDLIVAATARVRGGAVLTENVAEFSQVPGLNVVRPRWAS
jgi:predicted nucleic acid-binding protein